MKKGYYCPKCGFEPKITLWRWIKGTLYEMGALQLYLMNPFTKEIFFCPVCNLTIRPKWKQCPRCLVGFDWTKRLV